MSKPDRFEQMVVKTLVRDTRDNMPIAEFRYLAVTLLRREHSRVLRLIKARIAEVERGSPCQENTTYALALRDILAALDKMRK